MSILLPGLLLGMLLGGCAATAERRAMPMAFTHPRDGGLSDEQAEAFFEGSAPAGLAGAVITAAPQQTPQATPPSLR